MVGIIGKGGGGRGSDGEGRVRGVLWGKEIRCKYEALITGSDIGYKPFQYVTCVGMWRGNIVGCSGD